MTDNTKERLLEKVDELVTLANTQAASDPAAFQRCYAGLLKLLESFYGADCLQVREITGANARLREKNPYEGVMDRHLVPMLQGQLVDLRRDLDLGLLERLEERAETLASAAVFSDFLSMAEYLLQQGYKDPAAVLVGAVLEEHLRRLCRKRQMRTEEQKSGKSIPKKADLLNAELAKVGAYSKLDQKSVLGWLDLRNSAAHGNFANYTKQQVNLMLQSVQDFINRTTDLA